MNKPRFKHDPGAKKPPVDEKALERFAAGADGRSLQDPRLEQTKGTEAGSDDPATAAKKLTVLVDRERWLKLKQVSAIEDRSAQKIFIDALDLYFRDKG